MLFESLSILCVYNNSRISFYTLILAFRFLHRSHFVLPIIHTTDLGTPDPNKDFMRINGGFYTFDTLKEWIEAELRSKYDATGTSKPSVTTTLTDALNVYLDSKGIGKVSLLDSGVNVDALVITFNGKIDEIKGKGAGAVENFNYYADGISYYKIMIKHDDTDKP